jgi:hypothetical protein
LLPSQINPVQLTLDSIERTPVVDHARRYGAARPAGRGGDEEVHAARRTAAPARQRLRGRAAQPGSVSDHMPPETGRT